MRGQRVLFESYEQPAAATAAVRAGRSPELHAARTELLCARFHWYRTFSPQLNYEFIIGRLSVEFQLSSARVIAILGDSTDELARLRKAAHPKSWYSQRWPWMCW